jgi:S1-C subfamily serine protease
MLSASIYFLLGTCFYQPAPRPANISDLGLGFLGVTFQNDTLGNGLIISQVFENTPADHGGLRVNDHILQCEGTPVSDTDSFIKFIGKTRPGKTLQFSIMRDSEKINLKIKIGLRPENVPFQIGNLQHTMED